MEIYFLQYTFWIQIKPMKSKEELLEHYNREGRTDEIEIPV